MSTLIHNPPAEVDTPRDAEGKILLVGLSKAEISRHLEKFGIEPKKLRMRTKQIFHWIYHWGARDFESMSNIARPLQTKLAQHFSLARPEIVERQVSVDGTRKYLTRMAPGIEVESCLLYTSPSPRDQRGSRMPSSA